MNEAAKPLMRIFDDAVRALKDRRDAFLDALRDAAGRLFPAPSAVPVPARNPRHPAPACPRPRR